MKKKSFEKEKDFNEWLATFDSNESKTKGIVGFFYKMYINETLKNLKMFKDSLILDVGSGEGVILKDSRIKSIQLDISELRLKEARKYNNRLVCADAKNLPFKKCAFGCVLMIAILEHVSNPIEIIRETKRILKVDGNVIILIPNDINMSIGRLILFKFPPRYPGHLSFITPGKLKKWLNNDFYIEKSYPLPFKFMPFAFGLYYFLTARKIQNC